MAVRARDHLFKTQNQVFQHLQEATGRIKLIEDLSRYPADWTIEVANTPAVITCTDVMADAHPELVVACMKAMIKVGQVPKEQWERRTWSKLPRGGELEAEGVRLG